MNREGQKQVQKLSGEDIAKHNSRDDCWVIIHGKAYDVTECKFSTQHSDSFLPEQPLTSRDDSLARTSRWT